MFITDYITEKVVCWRRAAVEGNASEAQGTGWATVISHVQVCPPQLRLRFVRFPIKAVSIFKNIPYLRVLTPRTLDSFNTPRLVPFRQRQTSLVSLSQPQTITAWPCPPPNPTQTASQSRATPSSSPL